MSYLIPEPKLFVDASGDVSIPGHLNVESISATGDITTTGGIVSTSTTAGFLPPQLTTTQRNAIISPVTGLEVFNTTTNQPEFYNGSAWVAVGGVTSFNSITGPVTLAAGTNITLTPTGSTITISSSGSGGTSYQQDLFPWVGSNVFTLTFIPISNSQIVFFNGIALVSGSSYDYVLIGTTLTLNAGIILKAGDKILVIYTH